MNFSTCFYSNVLEILNPNTQWFNVWNYVKLYLGCKWEKLGRDGIVAETEGETVGGGNYSGQTLDQCKDLCNLNSECKSFSFRVEDGKCTLKDMILTRNSKTKKVPGTCTYYEPAACHGNYIISIKS